MNMVPWKQNREDTVMDSLRNEFNKLFDRFWTGQLEPLQIGRWVPAVDVSETEDEVLVRAELPGLTPEELDIGVEGDVLTIRGEKREEQEQREENYYRVERQYGGFARSVQLPAAIEKDKVDAVMKNGVLTIRLPKSEEQKPKRIRVNAT